MPTHTGSLQANNLLPPLAVPRREAIRLLGGSTKLVQRMLYWTANGRNPSDRWLEVLRPGGRRRHLLITRRSVEAAFARLIDGDCPPPLPCERRAAPSTEVSTACRQQKVAEAVE